MQTLKYFLTVAMVLVTILSVQSPTLADICDDDQLWNGSQCVSLQEVIASCDELPDGQRRFCTDVIVKRFELYRAYIEHNILITADDEVFSQFGEDTTRTAVIAPLLRTNVSHICVVRGDIVQCTALSSLVAFLNNEGASLLLIDLRDLARADAVMTEHSDLFLNCGNGLFDTVSVVDIFPDYPNLSTGMSENPLEIPEGGHQADEWWREMFPQEGVKPVVDYCARLGEEQGGRGGGISGGLGGYLQFGSSLFSSVSLDQCTPLSVGDYTFDQFADAILDSVNFSLTACNSIMPMDSSDDIKRVIQEIIDIIREAYGSGDANEGYTTTTEENVPIMVYTSPRLIETRDGTRVTVESPSGYRDVIEMIRYPDGTVDYDIYQYDPDGILIFHDDTKIPPVRLRGMDDCLDPAACAICQRTTESFIPDALDCITGWGNPELCQETLLDATECCSANPGAVPMDPRMVLPNPEGGYMCYAERDPAAAREEYCSMTCSVASVDGDCHENCMSIGGHPALDYDWMRQTCFYMLSEETCWQASIPEELLGHPLIPDWGQDGPPMPYNVDVYTLFPGIIQRIQESGIAPGNDWP